MVGEVVHNERYLLKCIECEFLLFGREKKVGFASVLSMCSISH